ncbi:hypothetical protein GGI42DRAFT_236034 [Trichoderma sp. SZMC 28013]
MRHNIGWHHVFDVHFTSNGAIWPSAAGHDPKQRQATRPPVVKLDCSVFAIPTPFKSWWATPLVLRQLSAFPVWMRHCRLLSPEPEPDAQARLCPCVGSWRQYEDVQVRTRPPPLPPSLSPQPGRYRPVQRLDVPTAQRPCSASRAKTVVIPRRPQFCSGCAQAGSGSGPGVCAHHGSRWPYHTCTVSTVQPRPLALVHLTFLHNFFSFHIPSYHPVLTQIRGWGLD